MAEVGNPIEHIGLHVLDQIAAAFLRVRQKLTQRHALDLLIRHHGDPHAGGHATIGIVRIIGPAPRAEPWKFTVPGVWLDVLPAREVDRRGEAAILPLGRE